MTDVLDTKVTVPRVRPTRRSFLKWSGVAAGEQHWWQQPPTSACRAKLTLQSTIPECWMRTRPCGTPAPVNCQSRCAFRFQVKDGQIVRVLPDNTGSDELGDLRNIGCVRGRNQRERVYSADRLKKPLKRAGERGEGKWGRRSPGRKLLTRSLPS